MKLAINLTRLRPCRGGYVPGDDITIVKEKDGFVIRRATDHLCLGIAKSILVSSGHVALMDLIPETRDLNDGKPIDILTLTDWKAHEPKKL